MSVSELNFIKSLDNTTLRSSFKSSLLISLTLSICLGIIIVKISLYFCLISI